MTRLFAAIRIAPARALLAVPSIASSVTAGAGFRVNSTAGDATTHVYSIE